MKRLTKLWNSLPDGIKRAVHTFWQTFLSTFILGLSSVIVAPDITTARVTLYALAASSFASALSALKAALLSYLEK